MEQKSKKSIPEINYFGDVVTEHIHAQYRNGKFYYFETEEEVVLKLGKNSTKGVYVRITAPLHCLPEDKFNAATQRVEKKILEKGSILSFELKYEISANSKYLIRVELLEDLCTVQMGHKHVRLLLCKVKVISYEDLFNNRNEIMLEKTEFNSLNQVYTQTSIQLRKNNRSHTCNVFNTFKLANGRVLDLLR